MAEIVLILFVSLLGIVFGYMLGSAVHADKIAELGRTIRLLDDKLIRANADKKATAEMVRRAVATLSEAVEDSP